MHDSSVPPELWLCPLYFGGKFQPQLVGGAPHFLCTQVLDVLLTNQLAAGHSVHLVPGPDKQHNESRKEPATSTISNEKKAGLPAFKNVQSEPRVAARYVILQPDDV